MAPSQVTSHSSPQPLDCLAVDVGNSGVKVAGFAGFAGGVAQPQWTVQWSSQDAPDTELLTRIDSQPKLWYIASVCRPARLRLEAWLGQRRPHDVIRNLSYQDMPLRVLVDQPQAMGIDRLAAAVGANLRRDSQHAAIVVDGGTAVTVDAIDRSGALLGGFILSGPRLSAQALAANTDLLPQIDLRSQEPLPSLGRNTRDAIRGGILWGLIGSVRLLVNQLRSQLEEPVTVFISGGSLETLVPQLVPGACHVPDLVLTGIAYAGGWSEEHPRESN